MVLSLLSRSHKRLENFLFCSFIRLCLYGLLQAMTEYTTSSEAIREFLTARDRTAHWVGQHSGSDPGFLSPSSPPSILSDSDTPTYGASDDDDDGASSSHSLPPRMVLRYGDGRADVPISTDHVGPTHPPWSRSAAPPNPIVYPPTNYIHSASNNYMQYNRSRAVSHTQAQQIHPSNNVLLNMPPRDAQSLSYATSHSVTPQPNAEIPPPRSPESIMVLPSRQDGEAQQNTGPTGTRLPHNPPQPPPLSIPNSHLHAVSSHTTLGQNTRLHQPGSVHGSMARGTHSVPQRVPMDRDIVSPKPQRAIDTSERSRMITRSPPIVHSQSQPLPTPSSGASRFFEHHTPSSRAQSQLPYTYSPPAIVYAASSKKPKSNYHPPAIIYSPSPSHHTQSHSHTSSSHGHQTHHAHSGPPAPSITYSHSAPLPRPPTNARQAVARPYHSQHPSPTSPVVSGEHFGSLGRSTRDEVRGRSRGPGVSNDRGRSGRTVRDVRSRSPTPSLDDGSDSGSRTSGSTYYILPTPGQKVQVIVSRTSFRLSSVQLC